MEYISEILSAILSLSGYLKILVGAALSFVITLTGIGGGILYVPVVKVLFSLEISVAIGTVSLSVLFTRILGFIFYARQKQISYHEGSLFLLGALPATMLAATYINLRIKNLEAEALMDFQAGLTYAVIATVLLALGFMVLQRTSFMKKLNYKRSKKRNSIYLFVSSIISGLALGFTGVGGGVLVIPALSLFTKLSMKKSIGTSIFISTLMFVIVSLVYSKGGQVEYVSSLLIAIGSFLGVPVAARMSMKIPDKTMHSIIIIFILIVLVVMVIQV